ncbi:sugar nucleotide-binding protein [Nocardioides yefusunii]|uniref:dTDP-4-dehydrorhamnose reductase n=1 Tax=Nocardioides yefusunii TaxID=2500546 RepID=A0ABW1QTR2_9ACTN|nr:sugar nucleotide-binding protein [Nocardioides yefusunii]
MTSTSGASTPLPHVTETPIEGLLVVQLDLREDPRGWFKENWQRAKMTPAGLPDFGPVQHNLSFNTDRGVARGFHAEPWDKYLTIAHGRVFAAWVDMREGPTFGQTFSMEMDPSVGVFVPRGVANSYQTLTDAATYSYLVNQHWRPDAAYPGVALSDPALGIEWPIPLDECILSEKDLSYGPLTPEMAIPRQRMLVLGGNGQVGRALALEFPDALVVGRDVLDITDADAVAAWDWRAHDVVVNAAAYTAVDAAETDQGRRDAWAANATAPARLAALSREHGFTLVHFSSDYVFSGTAPEGGWTESSAFAPLGVYAQSKAAGDLAVAAAPHHYVLRCSWVVGDGANFVATMQSLAARGVSPSVVDDQIGRPTFTDEIARAVRHLLETRPPYGTYHLSNGGDATSFHALAQEVFAASGRPADDVTAVSTAEYTAGLATTPAPRPDDSRLDLSALLATGFEPRDWRDALTRYLS